MKRVLVAQPFGIGDALFVTPLLRALKEEGGAERVDVLVGSRTREVLETNPFVDEIYVIDRDEWRRQGLARTLRDLARLLLRLRRRGYDLCIDGSLARPYSFLAWALGIPERIGLDFKGRGFFLTKKVAVPIGYASRHVIEYYADLGRLAGLAVREEKPDFFLTEEDKRKAREVLGRAGFGAGQGSFVACAPGGGESWGRDAHFKRWSPVFFARALETLAREMPFDGVVVLGSAPERALGEELLAAVRKRGLNLAGSVSLRESAAVMCESLFLLANDSGLVHMARALEIPLTALYGPVDEKIYGPHPPESRYVAIGRTGLDCRPCYRSFRYNAACGHRACLTELYPEEVVQRMRAGGFLKSLADFGKNRPVRVMKP